MLIKFLFTALVNFKNLYDITIFLCILKALIHMRRSTENSASGPNFVANYTINYCF